MDETDRLSEFRRMLRDELGSQRYDVWVGDAVEVSYHDRALRIACASSAETEWLRRRLHRQISQCFHAVWGDGGAINYIVQEIPQPAPAHVAGPDLAPQQEMARRRQPGGKATDPSSKRCPRLTFDSLAEGTSNKLAVATVRSAIEQPGRFAPLLLYGGSGVGKTHLLQAAAAAFRKAPTRLAVLQLTAEQFTGQFLGALADRTLPSFRQKCRSGDVLLIDDAQFLIGKKATLEEMLFTIDALLVRGKQVILTSDRPPREFPPAAASLAAKLSGGLAMQIDPPDYEMRVAIVRAIAARVRAELSPGTPEYVARQIVGSARLLAGAVNRLVATSMAIGAPIDVDLAVPALADFSRQHTPQVKLADVQRAVCEVFGVEPARLKSKEKSRGLVEPRMVAMWLARRYTRAALSEIGEYFGRRSHSTVVAAQKKCDRLVGEKANLHVGETHCPIDDAIRRVEAVLRTA